MTYFSWWASSCQSRLQCLCQRSRPTSWNQNHSTTCSTYRTSRLPSPPSRASLARGRLAGNPGRRRLRPVGSTYSTTDFCKNHHPYCIRTTKTLCHHLRPSWHLHTTSKKHLSKINRGSGHLRRGWSDLIITSSRISSFWINSQIAARFLMVLIGGSLLMRLMLEVMIWIWLWESTIFYELAQIINNKNRKTSSNFISLSPIPTKI